MDRFISQKFRFYSFVCIVLLMLVHGYNLQDAYLQPYSMVGENLTITTFVEYFLANGALRFRIPMLFIISGYIYALQDYKVYKDRIKKRFSSLMVPYFIWSAVGLGITFILQQYTYTAGLVEQAAIDQLNDNRPYAAIGWGGIIYRWIAAPISYQLWFIRSLFIYNLLYPLLKWVVVRYSAAWFTILFFLWYTGFQLVFIEGQGLLFFTFGIWLKKSNYPIEKKPGWYSHFLGWLFFIGVSIIKTFMAFELFPGGPVTFYTMISLQVITVLSGIIAVWYGADGLVRWCMQRKWFLWLSSFSFVIYGMHVPIIVYLSVLLFRILDGFPYHRLLIYLVAPVFVLAICISTGALLRSWVPRVYRLVTGGRGF